MVDLFTLKIVWYSNLGEPSTSSWHNCVSNVVTLYCLSYKVFVHIGDDTGKSWYWQPSFLVYWYQDNQNLSKGYQDLQFWLPKGILLVQTNPSMQMVIAQNWFREVTLFVCIQFSFFRYWVSHNTMDPFVHYYIGYFLNFWPAKFLL